MELSNEQSLAVGSILRSKERVLRLGGVAGSGKSVCVAEIAKRIPVQIITPTWKAALVLHERGFKDAMTVHRLLFRPVEDERGLRFKVDGLKADLLQDSKLLIVDEASMIDKWTYDKILSCWKGRILFVGDHYQLPPIKPGFSTMVKPDYTLEEVHRQAAGSPIIQLATKIRQRQPWSWPKEGWAKAADAIKDGYQAIVWTNKQRVLLNHGVTGTRFPRAGDKLIILDNKPNEDLYNGMLIEPVEDIKSGVKSRCTLKDRYFEVNTCSILKEKAITRKTVEEDWNVADAGVGIDYSYALTCHKAQGSSFDNVVVVVREDPQWLYTAVTRAANNLLLSRG